MDKLKRNLRVANLNINKLVMDEGNLRDKIYKLKEEHNKLIKMYEEAHKYGCEGADKCEKLEKENEELKERKTSLSETLKEHRAYCSGNIKWRDEEIEELKKKRERDQEEIEKLEGGLSKHNNTIKKLKEDLMLMESIIIFYRKKKDS